MVGSGSASSPMWRRTASHVTSMCPEKEWTCRLYCRGVCVTPLFSVVPLNFSIFLKAENQLSRKLPNFVKNEVRAKLHYKSNRFRLDNSGEILRLKTLCEDTGLGIHFEFTARAIPQQNDIVERQFATL